MNIWIIVISVILSALLGIVSNVLSTLLQNSLLRRVPIAIPLFVFLLSFIIIISVLPNYFYSQSTNFDYKVRVLSTPKRHAVPNAKVTMETGSLTPITKSSDDSGIVIFNINDSYQGKPAKLIIDADGYVVGSKYVDLLADQEASEINLIPDALVSIQSTSVTSAPNITTTQNIIVSQTADSITKIDVTSAPNITTTQNTIVSQTADSITKIDQLPINGFASTINYWNVGDDYDGQSNIIDRHFANENKIYVWNMTTTQSMAGEYWHLLGSSNNNDFKYRNAKLEVTIQAVGIPTFYGISIRSGEHGYCQLTLYSNSKNYSYWCLYDGKQRDNHNGEIPSYKVNDKNKITISAQEGTVKFYINDDVAHTYQEVDSAPEEGNFGLIGGPLENGTGSIIFGDFKLSDS